MIMKDLFVANNGISNECMLFVDLYIVTKDIAITLPHRRRRPCPKRTTETRSYWIVMARTPLPYAFTPCPTKP